MELCPLTERSTRVDCIPMHGGGYMYIHIYICANSPRVQSKIHATYKCKVKARKVKVLEWSVLGNTEPSS